MDESLRVLKNNLNTANLSVVPPWHSQPAGQGQAGLFSPPDSEIDEKLFAFKYEVSSNSR
jgi:hypothetical protein